MPKKVTFLRCIQFFRGVNYTVTLQVWGLLQSYTTSSKHFIFIPQLLFYFNIIPSLHFPSIDPLKADVAAIVVPRGSQMCAMWQIVFFIHLKYYNNLPLKKKKLETHPSPQPPTPIPTYPRPPPPRMQSPTPPLNSPKPQFCLKKKTET